MPASLEIIRVYREPLKNLTIRLGFSHCVRELDCNLIIVKIDSWKLHVAEGLPFTIPNCTEICWWESKCTWWICLL